MRSRPEPLSASIRSALTPAAGTPLFTCFSDLTRLECQVLPIQGNTDLLDQYNTFFLIRRAGKVGLQPEVFDHAAELRARHGMETPDARHLAAAIWSGCDELWTNDLRLSSAAEGLIRIRVPERTV